MPQHRMSTRFKWEEEQVKLAPKCPGAYVLEHNGTIVYIGSAETSIHSRLCSHKKAARFLKVTHFRFKEVNWKSEAREEEHRLIEAFKKKNGGKLPRIQQRGVNKPGIW